MFGKRQKAVHQGLLNKPCSPLHWRTLQPSENENDFPAGVWNGIRVKSISHVYKNGKLKSFYVYLLILAKCHEHFMNGHDYILGAGVEWR